MAQPVGSVFPIDPWMIRETGFEPGLARRNETIFSLGNGRLGLRGNLEEGHPGEIRGTYINGFYDETPIVYGEIAFGYARNRQVMLNVADAKRMAIMLGDEAWDIAGGTILSWDRCLDLAAGILTRRVRWRSPAGVEAELEARRLVSLARPEIAAIDLVVRLCGNGDRQGAPIAVESGIDAGIENASSGDDPRVGAAFPRPPLTTTAADAAGCEAWLVQKTRNTGLSVACVAVHSPGIPTGSWATTTVQPSRVVLRFEAPARAREVRVAKYLAYTTTREHLAAEVLTRAREAAAKAAEAGFEALAAEQRGACARFWQAADVRIEGDDALQQGLRYNIFSLFQSAGRDGHTSIAAKGLTGQGYEGHYFWDTEIYVQPFFTYTQPAIARALLQYRRSILDKARARAAEMSERGALFPWRTIGGEETSAYFPAGSAQYHIDADIVYAMRTYVRATGDASLLSEGGAELLFETARLWVGLGFFNPRRAGAFCIDEVTGPDEYSALVNNNFFTNTMARENLSWAAEVARGMRDREPAEYERLAASLHLDDAEIESWERAAAAMYLPFDKALGIHAQDDAFLDREPWDFTERPANRRPLLLHYHYLVIYRHQVLKQPDVVLAQILLSRHFSTAQKKRNFDYYDPLTTGDSSLSPCIQSVAAAELGYAEKAYQYFSRTARMDLDDVNGNVEDGVHTAAMAGTWISVVRGFAGLRDDAGTLSFYPRLPSPWASLTFRLRVRGCLLECSFSRDRAAYTLLEGESLSFEHRRRPVTVRAGSPVLMSLVPELTCVVFDLDGVLTNTAEMHYLAWKRLADEEGIPFDRTVNEKLRGVSRAESLRIILREAKVTRDEGTQARLADRKNGYYRALIAGIRRGDLLPGMAELLAGLRARGVKTAVASVSRSAAEVVDRLGIGPAIDLVVDPGSIVKGKPDPEIFLRAADDLAVPYENCAGVEDAEAGVQSIKAAGMFAVGIGTSLPGADWLLPDTRDLTVEELFRRFNAARPA
jgi:alpha,alpha-trehalose phosphorylase